MTTFESIDKHNAHQTMFDLFRAEMYEWWESDRANGCTCPPPWPTMTNAGTDAMTMDAGWVNDPDCPAHGHYGATP